jgi:prophage antirepressor-like protein
MDGRPWFVAADVCRVVGLPADKGTGRYLRRLAADERRVIGRAILGDAGGSGVTLISESGLRQIVMRSKKTDVGAFQDWVTDAVIPSLQALNRQDGPHPINVPSPWAVSAMAI